MLTATIPSYVYYEYSDDSDLRAFARAYNTLTQQYVTWFATIGLPVYTGLTGPLLDWIANSLYGYYRPTLGGDGTLSTVTWVNNNGDPVTWVNDSGGTVTWTTDNSYRPTLGGELATDDVFQRCLTWEFFKGDGTQFTIAWLKRRVQRWLAGPNGIDPGVSQTYQVSVTFGPPNIVYINILGGIAVASGGAVFNEFSFNLKQFDEFDVTTYHYVDTTLAPKLKEAIDSGVVSLPFQYTYVVGINP
jgi:hypothetical protein